MKQLSRLVIAAVAALGLVACSGEEADHRGHDSSTPDIAAGEEFNGADVRFATDMIQHHAQALAMVDLTRGRELSPRVTGLAEEILTAQALEIELMTDWLTEWDQPIPETVRDHANAHGDHGGDMTALEDAGDAEFEQMWLRMMIEHHEGAIEMARAEQEDGEYDEAVDLAETIVSTQEAEIDRMEELLQS